MTKRNRDFGGVASISARLAAPALVAMLTAACGSSGSSSGSNSSGSNASGASGTMSTSSGSNAGGMSAASGTGGMAPCKGDADCASNPGHKVCDPTTNSCVGCLPANDMCPQGQYCDPSKKTCAMGCNDKADCSVGMSTVCDQTTHQCVGCLADADCGGGMNTHCDQTTHLCVGCLADTDCALGNICSAGICTAGCSPLQGCVAGQTCCTDTCIDVSNTVNNCGACGKACPLPANSVPTCTNGMCGMGPCTNGFADCNVQAADGCEWNILQDGPCTCVPGATQPCYNGSPGTKGVGPCKGGTSTCNAMGTGWGACAGQVLPQPEVCGNLVDEDCSGVLDDAADLDGDGWNACNGDCCETVAQCPFPSLVNPGAYEVLNNNVNDDCDAATSDTVAAPACSTVQKFTGVTAINVAQAMDLCQTTTANPPMPMKKWGLITASQLLANGTTPNAADLANIQNFQNAVLQNYGTGGVLPHKGATMAGLSSGAMRDANDPGFVVPVTGSSYNTSLSFGGGGAPLSTYVSAHGGGLLPGKCGNVACAVGTGANDSTNTRLVIRVPTNAKSFSYDFRFFSGEYQSFQCTAFNDYYLAMLTSGAANIPVDHNISFDVNNNPVSVNNGFFQVCGGNGKNCGPCPNGTAELAGTGMDQVNGGGTAWLTTDAPVVPGETMTLELVIFDVNDHIYDSLVLVDNFRWSLATAVVGTHM